MRRVVWAATLAVLVVAAGTTTINTVHQKKSGFAQPSWTWEEVVKGAADNHKTEPHQPFTQEIEPYSYIEDANIDEQYDSYEQYDSDYKYDSDYQYHSDNQYDGEERFQNVNDYEYVDEDQFRNDDYVYVDDIDDVENPEEFQLKHEHANRRALDFLYHTFLQPVLQPNRAAEPSLIGEVFQTIDSHINRDFTSLASLVAQGTATAAAPVDTPQRTGQASGTPIATAITSGPTGDDLLVTDDLGNQHLVSVDDIVQSLSVLDERSLVDLLLGPEGSNDPTLSIQLPAGNQVNRAPDVPATQTASAPLNSFQLPAPAPAPLPVPVTPSSASPPTSGVPIPSFASPTNGGVPIPSSASAPSSGVPLLTAQTLPAVQDNIVDTGEIIILPGQLTKAIRDAAAVNGEVFRPVRHTGPSNSATSDNEESFLVTDEQGNVQIITMNDILSSLSNLDEETLASLLIDTSAASLTVSNPALSNNLNNISGSAPVSTTASPPVAPLIETDYEGNVHIRPSQSGSIKIDLNDHTAEHSKLNEPVVPAVQSTTPAPPPPTKNKTVVSSDGTHVSTDNKGNIYITPDPDKPFTLDIQNIIALAEQAEQSQTKEDKASEFSGAVVNQISSTKTSTPTPTPERGNQILAYLAGVEDFLPNPILPGPLRTEKPQQPVQPQAADLRTALLNTLRLHRQPQQQTTPAPVAPAPATPGIGAQLSGLLSRIIGQASQAVGSQPVTPVPEPQDEVIQLVVRQQFEDGGEEIYGNINVPLPQSIHHSYRALQKLQQQENRNSGNTNEAQRRQDTVKVQDWREDIPKAVVNAVESGKPEEPKFDPTKAVRRGTTSQEPIDYLTLFRNIAQRRRDTNNGGEVETVLAEERDYGPPKPQSLLKTGGYDHGPPSKGYGSGHSLPQPEPVYAAPEPVQYAPAPVYEEPSKPTYPLIDIFLLADYNKAKKQGYDNYSKGVPLIGDPRYFVDTRSHQHHY